MKNAAILFFILFFHSAFGQQTIDKLNANQLKLPKESVNKALYLDGAGQVKSSSTISDTELGYLEGLTDTLVNLLSGKANDTDVVKLTGNQSVDGVKTFTGKLVASSTVNGSIPCPVMTEAERDLFTPVEGDCVYNSDTLKLNIFDGSVWKDVGGAGGISLWLTANPYNVNDIIIESDKIYRCLVAHTSGVFATDLAAAKWTEVSASPVTPYSLNDGGTNKALTAVNGGIVWVDADSFEILAAGVSGQVLQSNGAASPSWVNKSISGKAENSSAITLEEIQVSNNQLTQTDTNKHLVETGNTNILVNPSFEHSTFSTGWNNVLGTFAVESTVVVHGKKSAKVTLSSQAFDLRQDSTLYQAQFADGVQGLASVRVKTTVSGIRVCSRQNGVVSSSLCVNVQANGKWGLYKVPFTLGGISNGIEIDSNSVAVTGDVYVDDAFVGAVDLAADVDQSRIAGESYFAGTAGCSWSRTSTTVGAFGSTASCPGPTITEQNLGQWQTTDSDLPRQTINNLPAGKYKVNFHVFSSMSVANGTTALSIYDGNSFCEPVRGNGNTAIVGTVVSCIFTYQSSGNRTFELYGASGGDTLIIGNAATSPRSSVKFILEYYGSGTTYSSTNADTDWQSCQFASLAWQGFGTVSGVETQCKRQGSDLLMRGKFVSGTVAALEARLNLPTWNGVQLTSKGAQSIPTIQTAGSYIRNNVSTEKGGMLFIEPSVSYLTFGSIFTFGTTSTNATSKVNGSDITIAGSTIVITARIPIEGWENSNIIIGQFNGLESCTNSYECTDVFSAKVNSAGVVSDENIDWINGNCSNPSTGNYTCTFRTSLFAVSPNCVVSNDNGSGAAQTQSIAASSTLSYLTTNSAGTATAGGVIIHCQKQGVDFVSKTAKAVASDQNLRTPGVTNGVVYAATVTIGTGAINSEVGEWLSTCSNTALGTATCNLTSGAFANSLYVCSGTSSQSGANAVIIISTKTTSSFVIQSATSQTGVVNGAGPVDLMCVGVK